MLRPRIIPCLLIQNSGLVKTVKFKDPKYVGDPINAVKIFNEKEADELIVLDIDASRKGIEPDYKKIAHLAAECRMPLCYGGGIKSPEQAKRIISLGVEKVAISSAALQNPKLVNHVAEEIGNQSVVVVFDVKQKFLTGTHEIYIHNGTQKIKEPLVSMIEEMISMGAGEIVINSIDNDGMMKGFDIDLIKKVKSLAKTPVTFLGGAGSLDDIGQVISTCGVVGVSAGSLFVFKGPYKAVLINYPDVEAKDSLILKSLSTKH